MFLGPDLKQRIELRTRQEKTTSRNVSARCSPGKNYVNNSYLTRSLWRVTCITVSVYVFYKFHWVFFVSHVQQRVAAMKIFILLYTFHFPLYFHCQRKTLFWLFHCHLSWFSKQQFADACVRYLEISLSSHANILNIHLPKLYEPRGPNCASAYSMLSNWHKSPKPVRHECARINLPDSG